MSGHNNKLLLASIVAGIFLLMGCGPAVTEDEDGNQVARGPNNLSVIIHSPVAGELYGEPDPKIGHHVLGYTITEGDDSTDVPLNRLQGLVFNRDTEGNRLGGSLAVDLNADNSSETGTSYRTAPLPGVGEGAVDGEHEIELTIWQDEERTERWLTLMVPYATDTQANDVTVSGVDAFSQSSPTLNYTIDDGCFGTLAGCNETIQLFSINSSGTETLILSLTGDNNGYLLPTLAEGDYALVITYLDNADPPNPTTIRIVFTIDRSPNPVGNDTTITTNDSSPLLVNFTIDDPCVEPGTCTHVDSNGNPDWLIITLDDQPISKQKGEPLPTMTDGTHTLAITFTDNAGNSSTMTVTYIIDTSGGEVIVEDDTGDPGVPNPDDTQITDGGDALLITGSVGEGTVVFTVTQSGTANVYLDSDSDSALIAENIPITANEPTSVDIPSIGPGTYTIRIIARDDLGNPSDVISFNFAVLDAASPEIGINSPAFASGERKLLHPATATGGTYDVTLNFTVSDNATAPQDITVSVTLEEWQNDSGTWVLTASHVVGMGDAVTAFTDQEGTYEKVVALPDGNYRLVVTAEDDAATIDGADSNNTSTNATVRFKVDTLAPEVNVSHPAGIVTSNEPVLVFEADEEARENGVEVTLCQDIDGACWDTGVPADGKLRLEGGQPLPDGGYTVQVRLTDHAGFTGIGESNFTVKAAPSEILILNPLSNAVITGGKVKVKIQESGFTHVYLYWSFEGGSETLADDKPVGFPEPNVENFEFLPLPLNGKYTLRVRAVDSYGINADVSASVTVTADNSLPGVVITSPDDNNMNFRSSVSVPLTFLATSSQGNGITGYEVLLNGNAVDADGNALTENSTSLGVFDEFAGGVTIHTVSVKVTNANGSTTDNQDFFIDDSKPVVTILRPTGDSETATSVLLSYSVVDPNNPNERTSEETVKLDGTEIPQRSGDTIGDLVPGSSHILNVRVKDLAGNPSDVASVSFTVHIEEEDDDDWPKKGKSNCFLEAIKGRENVLRKMLKCVTDYHSVHHD